MIIVTLVACILGFLRIAGFTSASFQAVAHIYVGGLFGAYLTLRHSIFKKWLNDPELLKMIEVYASPRRSLYFYLAIGLTALEAIVFLLL